MWAIAIAAVGMQTTAQARASIAQMADRDFDMF
jgi:hypothetical protein